MLGGVVSVRWGGLDGSSLTVDGNQKSGGNSPNWGERSLKSYDFTGVWMFLAPSQVVGLGISEPSTVWCRYDEILIFVYRKKWSWRKSGEEVQDQDSWYFFPIEVHRRWCGTVSKNLVGQKPTDGGCNGGLSEGIDTKSIEAGGHVTWDCTGGDRNELPGVARNGRKHKESYLKLR